MRDVLRVGVVQYPWSRILWDMRVRVLYFGVLKDAFGQAGSDVVLADGASVADLLKVVRGQEGFWDSIAVAVNQEYAKGEAVLKEGDEVALLPPVSGGGS